MEPTLNPSMIVSANDHANNTIARLEVENENLKRKIVDLESERDKNRMKNWFITGIIVGGCSVFLAANVIEGKLPPNSIKSISEAVSRLIRAGQPS